MMPDAKARGFRTGRFSFNVKGGRCEACQGDGVIAIEMHFLPDVYVTCELCKGRRYNRETLDIKYRGKSIADVLDLTVDHALPLLENFPPIANKLRTLQDVGLGYIELGQSATTLSGGEAQRVKLAKELSKRGTGRTLYILDEPTTGPPLRRYAQAAGCPDETGGSGQHDRRHRAQSRCHQVGRLRDRPRAGGRRRRRKDCCSRDTGGRRGSRHFGHWPLPGRCPLQPSKRPNSAGCRLMHVVGWPQLLDDQLWRQYHKMVIRERSSIVPMASKSFDNQRIDQKSRSSYCRASSLLRRLCFSPFA